MSSLLIIKQLNYFIDDFIICFDLKI